MSLQYVEVTGSVDITRVLPVVPLYDLRLAAQLIPCTYDALHYYLKHHKAEHPAVYRRFGRPGVKKRLLSAEEIMLIRSRLLKGPGLANVLRPFVIPPKPDTLTPLNPDHP
jgi:hypothetical protein